MKICNDCRYLKLALTANKEQKTGVRSETSKKERGWEGNAQMDIWRREALRYKEKEGVRLTQPAGRELCTQPFIQVYGWSKAKLMSLSCQTKWMELTLCCSLPPSISPPFHPFLWSDPYNRPSRARSSGPGLSRCLGAPSHHQKPSLVCVTNEVSLSCSVARKQMELWDDIKHDKEKIKGTDIWSVHPFYTTTSSLHVYDTFQLYHKLRSAVGKLWWHNVLS